MRNFFRWVAISVLALGSTTASAAFHLWQITEFYANSNGMVQFIELTALAGSQQFLSGQTLTSSNGTTTKTFTFPSDLPGDTAGKKMLIATQSYAQVSVNLPPADYVVPNDFFFRSGGTINFAGSSDVWNHPAAPAVPLSLNRDGSTGTNSPTNFAGQTGSIPTPVTIGIHPPNITFSGTSMLTTSPPMAVVINNVGPGTHTIQSITASGDFTVGSGCLGSMPQSTQCGFDVYFRPTGEGLRTGTLTVTSNAEGSPHTANLSGTGERSLVTHYYRSILRREPDSGGKAFWTNEAARVAGLGANVNETWFSMAQQFYFSAEYAAFNRSNVQFVTDLYTTFFNRAPDSGGQSFWLNNLNGGMPREVALAAFMFSTEFRNFSQAIFGTATVRAEIDAVMDFYRGLLSRLPDDGGFAFWRDRFRAAQCQNSAAVTNEVEAISSAFALSAEYTGRNRTNAQYVGDLYNAFLRRGGDLEGVQFWIGTLTRSNNPLTREQLRVEFKNSPEFQARVNAIIAQGCFS